MPLLNIGWDVNTYEMPLGLQKIKLESNEECSVPDFLQSTENARNTGQSRTMLQLNDCGVYNTRTKIKLDRGSVETGMICIKAEAESKPDPKVKKTRIMCLQTDTVRKVGPKLKRKKSVQVPISVTPSGGKGQKKPIHVVQTRLHPVPIQPRIVPSTTDADQHEKLDVTRSSQTNLQHSKESIPVTPDASGQFLKVSMPSGYYMQNQTSVQQPRHLQPCSLGQQTFSNACQSPVFIQVCGGQPAGSSYRPSNQLTCQPVVLPQNSVSIQLAGNMVVPGISMMPRNLSLNPQLQSSGSLVNSQGPLQIGIPSGQIIQTLQNNNSLNSFIPNQMVHGNFQNPIRIQIPTNQVIQTNSQNQVQFNFPSNQFIQSNIQNPIQIQIPSTQLVHSGSQNTVQISSPSNRLVQNSMQIQIPASQLLQTSPTIAGPTLLPSLQSLNSKVGIKSPLLIKAKLPNQSVTILPSSPLIQKSIGRAEVQTKLRCDVSSQSSDNRFTLSKPQSKSLSKVAKVSRKPRKPKYSTRANTSSKVATQTQKPVSLQSYSTGTQKFIPIQPSINHLPKNDKLQNSLQVQVVNHNVLNAVQHQFPVQLGVPLSTTSNPSILQKPAVIQIADQRIVTSQSSTPTFRIVAENCSQLEISRTGSRALDSSKSLARTNLRGRALQQTTTKHSISETVRSCRITTRLSNTSALSQKHKSALPKQGSSKTNLLLPNPGCSGNQLKQLTLPGCEVAQLSHQFTVPASSLPTYTFVTTGGNLQPIMNLPNAQVLGTCSQISAPSMRSLEGLGENNKKQTLNISSKDSKETLIVLSTSKSNKSSDTQCFSVSVPNINSISQSANTAPQHKAKSKYVPILPRSSDNQMCIFNQTANDNGCFWGAENKKAKLIRRAGKRSAAMMQNSDDEDQELLGGQKCFVPLEMLKVEPNKFYSVSNFKRSKSKLLSRLQQTV